MKRKPSLRGAAAALLALLLLTFAACSGRSNPYVSRPQDSMILFRKEGRVYLANTESPSFTAEGTGAGEMNRDIVPLASGSAYYLEDGALWYKSYLEPAYKMTEGVSTIFYSIGSVFGVTEKGDLIRTGDGTAFETVLSGVELSLDAPFLESDNNVYVFASGALWRLVFGASPEKMQTVKAGFRFLSGDEKAVYYAADGAVWSLGHEGIAVQKISGNDPAEPVPLSSYASFAKKLFWRTGDGTVVAYDVKSRGTEKIGKAEEDVSGRVLPENANDARAFVFGNDGGWTVYDYGTGKTASLPAADWVYADGTFVYGFDREGLLVFDGEKITKGEKGTPKRDDADQRGMRALLTPDGYYYLTGPEEGYEATLYALSKGKAEKIADGVSGEKLPRAVHRYGGVSYFTGKAIWILDEETLESELFAEHENVIDFLPRSGGAFALYADGLLELMIYGESNAKTVAEGVEEICGVLYAPERLVTYPLR